MTKVGTFSPAEKVKSRFGSLSHISLRLEQLICNVKEEGLRSFSSLPLVTSENTLRNVVGWHSIAHGHAVLQQEFLRP